MAAAPKRGRSAGFCGDGGFGRPGDDPTNYEIRQAPCGGLVILDDRATIRSSSPRAAELTPHTGRIILNCREVSRLPWHKVRRTVSRAANEACGRLDSRTPVGVRRSGWSGAHGGVQ
jgi:hypothetical protein